MRIRCSGPAWIGPRRELGTPRGGRLQLGPARTDSSRMNLRSLRCAIATLVCLLCGSGCISNDGTPVFVDYGAFDVWSGKGMLVEVSSDESQCRVIVRDGGTTVIGGIYEVSTDRGEDRVPGLANVPIIGHLFKNKRRNDENEELLIFITPRVMKL